MSKIEYDVVQAESLAPLVEGVRRRSQEGWEPLGGIAVSTYVHSWEDLRKGGSLSDTYETWAQAIIRRS